MHLENLPLAFDTSQSYSTYSGGQLTVEINAAARAILWRMEKTLAVD
jgi:hypothetical protein